MDSLDNTLARSDIDLSSAQRSLAEAKETRDIQNARNEQAVENAWNDYVKQAEKVGTLNEELNNLKNSQEAKKKEIETLEKELTAKEKELADAKAGSSTGTVSGGDGGSSAESQGPINQLTAQVQDLQAQIQSLQSQMQSIQSMVTAKENELTQAGNTQDSLLSAYVRSAETQEDGIRNNDSSVLSREASLQSTKLSNSNAGASERRQIENYQKQIEACTVMAPVSGVVTNVNLEVGDGYNGSVILTIEDDSAYIVETQIDEYDIGKVKVGQEVVIKTNATGEEKLSGTVIHVAPRATTAQGQASGSVTYTVKISVDTPHEMLRMDMTAKLSIILEKNENVLTVPYDAVLEDEDGNFYVDIMEGAQPAISEQGAAIPASQNSTVKERGQIAVSADAATYTRVYVTKGIESDYYVEISGEGLTEGMQVVVPNTDEGYADIVERMMRRGPMGGF